ncbi:MAG: hypothetical protein ACE3L7_08435 [Candidatus Pristimantibacillus sp.]
MFICFVEYKIALAYREAYFEYTNRLLEPMKDNVHIYEGTDQPGLFVEIWSAVSEAEVEQMKKERCSQRSPWHHIAEWIPGGADKMHVWTFKPAMSGYANN